MVKRCSWADPKDPLYLAYHDNEWGIPVHDDPHLFEMLILESFQAGLSWACVLHKREAFRLALDGFDPQIISRYSPEKVEELMQNKDIIRNRRKISATIQNARIFLDIQKEFGSFSNYLWHFTEGETVIYGDGIIRATSSLSDTISKDLKARGMSFVGSTIIYAYLQAVGVINDHEACCDRCPFRR
ncbi:MAG: DNA-3-methyladenine glycosylase I [Ruminococcaceae bacterium]|nr:DNA-3-methyladenine glycosylase I [Oscillospiraceae bacterium]